MLYRGEDSTKAAELNVTESLEVDSVDGQAYAQLYEAISFPALLVVSEDGRLVQMWQGTMPSKAELSYYSERLS